MVTPTKLPRQFGGRDHTTVMHAVKTIESLSKRDGQFAEDVQLLKSILAGCESAFLMTKSGFAQCQARIGKNSIF